MNKVLFPAIIIVSTVLGFLLCIPFELFSDESTVGPYTRKRVEPPTFYVDQSQLIGTTTHFIDALDLATVYSDDANLIKWTSNGSTEIMRIEGVNLNKLQAPKDPDEIKISLQTEDGKNWKAVWMPIEEAK